MEIQEQEQDSKIVRHCGEKGEEVTKERASEGFKIQDEAYIEEDRG